MRNFTDNLEDTSSIFKTGFSHIDAILNLINKRTSPVNTRLILTELYLDGLKLNKYSPDVEDVFDKILYRPEENVTNYNMLEVMLEKYVNNNIQKYFGINVNEFLALTKPESDMYIKIAEKKEAEAAAVIARLNKDKGTPMPNVPYGNDMGGFTS